jgi:signal transduction histidine kinase
MNPAPHDAPGGRRPWSSIAFQVALRYGAFIVLTVAVVLAMFYVQMLGTMRARMDHYTNSSLHRLEQIARTSGIGALEREARSMLNDGVNSDNEVLIVTDPQGNTLIGNARLKHPRALSSFGKRELDVVRRGETYAARVQATPLDDGNMLIVGTDTRPLEEMEHLFVRASAWTALISVFIIAVGAAGLRRMVEERAANIRATMTQVAAGHLDKRIAVDPHPRDEFALLYRDINHMLDQLQQLMDGIRNVSNTIAHNLRTPLTRMLLQLRGAEQAPAAEQAATLARVAREVEELGVVFDKLLQIAEVESGTSRTRFARVEVRDLLLDVADLYAPVLEDSGGSLRAQVQDAPAALGDADLLASAIANLIDNAIKYGRAPEGGRGADIVLHAAPAQGPGGAPGIAITVRDHGPGVEPQALEQLGTRFFRARTDGQGYGLGLSSVRAIVELHGGRLEFANTHPGMQARIWLPAPPPA